MHNAIQLAYLLVSASCIFGLRQMSSPKTAQQGIQLAGWGMVFAVIVACLTPFMQQALLQNMILIGIAIVLGGGIAYYSAERVAMTSMPQMIALYNGMGGGAAGAIAIIELFHSAPLTPAARAIALIGAFIGIISFSGSIIAFAKLQGLPIKIRLPKKHFILNAILLGLSIAAGVAVFLQASATIFWAMIALLLIVGVTLTLPIGGGNMPVVISLFNAMTGLAVGLEGFVLDNFAMIIAGTVVGAAGTLLTQLMAKAMNQSLLAVFFQSSTTDNTTGTTQQGEAKAIAIEDAAIQLAYADRVIIVPGYGMAMAQAQHKIWELSQLLIAKNTQVKFAIHPVAGRMPGHMNVLLAEAGVPYELIADLDEINPEFSATDVVLVIGANDVVNPSAKTDTASPIYGMPILNADQAKQVLVIKRGQGKGFSGIENTLFFMDQTRLLYGDGQAIANQLIQEVRTA